MYLSILGYLLSFFFSLEDTLAVFEPGVREVHSLPLVPQEGGELPPQPAGLPEQQVHLL